MKSSWPLSASWDGLWSRSMACSLTTIGYSCHPDLKMLKVDTYEHINYSPKGVPRNRVIYRKLKMEAAEIKHPSLIRKCVITWRMFIGCSLDEANGNRWRSKSACRHMNQWEDSNEQTATLFRNDADVKTYINENRRSRAPEIHVIFFDFGANWRRARGNFEWEKRQKRAGMHGRGTREGPTRIGGGPEEGGGETMAWDMWTGLLYMY